MELELAKKWISEQLRSHTCEGADAEREARELAEFFVDDEPGLKDAVQRRLQHEPLGYILGWSPFLGRRFTVTPDVLIPRPATEIIVTKLIEDWRDQDATIIDVGTGSGCAAISFALELPRAKVIATDISDPALTIAHQNAEQNGSPSNLEFKKDNLLPSFPPSLLHSPIIFANLPYIPTADIDQLVPDVCDFEPRSALDGGPDGLDFYRELFQQLQNSRTPELPHSRTPALQHLYLEALPNQLDELAKIAKKHFPNSTSKKIFADSAQQNPTGVIIRT